MDFIKKTLQFFYTIFYFVIMISGMVSIFILTYKNLEITSLYYLLFLFIPFYYISIYIHEFGHYVFGKMVGIKIPLISIGNSLNLLKSLQIGNLTLEITKSINGGYTATSYIPESFYRLRLLWFTLGGISFNYLIMLILPNLGLEKRSVACDLASVFLLVNMFMFTLNFLPGKSKIQGIQTYKDGSVLLTVLFWDESEIQKRQDSIDLTKSFFLVRNEKWKEAEILFEKLKDKFPDLNYINFYLGILNLQKTNFKEAKVYFEKVSEPDPQYYYPALMNIAYLSIYNEFEINKALEYSKIAYDKLNDFSSIPYVSILFRAGKNDQAKEILFDYYKRNNTKLTTHHKALYLLLAYAYQLEGNNLKSEEFKNLALNEEMIYELTIKYTKFIYSLANWDFEKDHPNV